jgi:MFS family permease
MSEKTDAMGKYALIALMCTSFILTFMFSSINLALPDIGAEFNAGAIMISWIINGYILPVAALLLPLGRLADMTGRRKMYLLGSVSYALLTLAATLTHSVFTLTLLRILAGVSGAMILSTGMAILTATYPPKKRGQAMGLSTAVAYIGLTTGPVLGGIMNQHLGWRSIFYLTAFLGLIAALIIWQRLRGEWVVAEGESFDRLGSILYIIGIATVLYGLSSLSNIFWAKYAAIAGLGLLVLFVVVGVSRELCKWYNLAIICA